MCSFVRYASFFYMTEHVIDKPWNRQTSHHQLQGVLQQPPAQSKASEILLLHFFQMSADKTATQTEMEDMQRVAANSVRPEGPGEVDFHQINNDNFTCIVGLLRISFLMSWFTNPGEWKREYFFSHDCKLNVSCCTQAARTRDRGNVTLF